MLTTDRADKSGAEGAAVINLRHKVTYAIAIMGAV